MATATYRYEPDYVVPPGWILEERLVDRQISHAEFARRCGRSAKLISEIIAGKAPIEPVTALQFEKVLGLDASVWLGMESDYRLHQEREAEKRRAAKLAEWSKSFPVGELVKRGIIAKPSSNADRVSKLLSFFGVASVEAWQNRQSAVSVAYRHSPSFNSDELALATWLRLGELEAEKIECEAYNEAAFKRSLTRIRKLTPAQSIDLLAEARQLCRDSGVALVLVKPLPKTALSGAARWLTPRKAVIQLSARHKRDDHLWFSLFHEAAHILLHSKKSIFIDESNGKIAKADAQADMWAADFLVPPLDWKRFTATSRFSRNAVLRFAEHQGIAPSIVVGRLQHEEHIGWDALNDLRKSLRWEDTE